MRMLAWLALGLLGLSPVPAWAQSIKMGAVVPLTGRYGAGGAQIRAGYEFAVERLNAGGGITVGAPISKTTARPVANWALIDQMRKGIGVPVLIKGILTPKDAGEALKHGIDGMVISNYGGLSTPGMASSIEMLPSIADAVGGRAPILIDGSFRRGSDIFKALAYGASAVMIGRPVVWGLAAYGPEGAQQVLEVLQTEVARDMAHCGKPTIKDIDRSVVRVHEV